MPYRLILIAACVASLTVPAAACDRNRLLALQPACGESSDTSGIVDACLALAAADHECEATSTGYAHYAYAIQEAVSYGVAATYSQEPARKKYAHTFLSKMKRIRDDPQAPAALRDKAQTVIDTMSVNGFPFD